MFLMQQQLTPFFKPLACRLRGFAEDSLSVKSLLLMQKRLLNENAFVGATRCRPCHKKEFSQWFSSPHAIAFNTLLKEGRHFDSKCTPCHVTGFGLPSGFSVYEPQSILKGVQCEVCHGPGQKHMLNPSRTNIIGQVDRNICFQCHDDKHAPSFRKHFSEKLSSCKTLNNIVLDSCCSSVVSSRCVYLRIPL
jgi:hypothetical protein